MCHQIAGWPKCTCTDHGFWLESVTRMQSGLFNVFLTYEYQQLTPRLSLCYVPVFHNFRICDIASVSYCVCCFPHMCWFVYASERERESKCYSEDTKSNLWRKTLKALKAIFSPTHPPPPPSGFYFYITLAGGKHLDQLTDPVSAFASREILEDHQLASKRKKVFGHALLSSLSSVISKG